MLVRSRLPPRHLLRQLLPKPSNKTLLRQGRSHGTVTPPSASPQAEAAWVALSPVPAPRGPQWCPLCSTEHQGAGAERWVPAQTRLQAPGD